MLSYFILYIPQTVNQWALISFPSVDISGPQNSVSFRMSQVCTPKERAATARLLGVEETDDDASLFAQWAHKVHKGSVQKTLQLIAIDARTFCILQRTNLHNGMKKVKSAAAVAYPTSLVAAVPSFSSKKETAEETMEKPGAATFPKKVPIISPLKVTKKVDLSEVREINVEKAADYTIIMVMIFLLRHFFSYSCVACVAFPCMLACLGCFSFVDF
jgi:hypothetical protein